jgi:hypothetical protein
MANINEPSKWIESDYEWLTRNLKLRNFNNVIETLKLHPDMRIRLPSNSEYVELMVNIVAYDLLELFDLMYKVIEKPDIHMDVMGILYIMPMVSPQIKLFIEQHIPHSILNDEQMHQLDQPDNWFDRLVKA